MNTKQWSKLLWWLALLGLLAPGGLLLAIGYLATRLPYADASRLVNAMAADNQVKMFTETGYALTPKICLPAGAVLVGLGLAWLALKRRSLSWTETILLASARLWQADLQQWRQTAPLGRPAWLAALGLAAPFWAVYTWLAIRWANATTMFERTNPVFDTDLPFLVKAIAGSGGEGQRHPLFMLFVTPFGLLAARLSGSEGIGAALVTAFAGALAVALMTLWLVRAGLKPLPAALWAALLGVSTTHLMFGTLPETYIFSAASLILVYLAAAAWPGNLIGAVLAGVVTFGITVTNLAHALIAYLAGLLGAENRREWVTRAGLMIALVLVLVAILNLASIAIFRTGVPYFAPWFYIEQEMSYTTLEAGEPITGRLAILAADMFLYDLAAPAPYLVVQEQPYLGGPPPTGRLMASFHASSWRNYSPLGWAAAAAWLGLLAWALVEFVLRQEFRRPLILGLAASLAFNFFFHTLYGLDVFLYSAHWAFLVVSLAALALRRVADHRLFQAGLFGVIVLLAANNAGFLEAIAHLFAR